MIAINMKLHLRPWLTGIYSQPMAGEVSVKAGASSSAMNPFSLNQSVLENGFH